MIETNEPMTATGANRQSRRGDLVQTARDAGAAAQERLGDLRDAALSSLDEAKSAATEKVDETKDQAADEIARDGPRVSKRPPRRWKARPSSRTCFARPRTA